MPASWSPRVWLSVVLGIFLQPFVFLYVNRPGLFWLYLVASLVCAGVDWYFGWALTLLFSLLCPLHAALIARRYDPAAVGPVVMPPPAFHCWHCFLPCVTASHGRPAAL